MPPHDELLLPLVIVVVLVAAGAVVVGAGHEGSALEGDLEVVGATCDGSNVTTLDLRVEIDEDSSVLATPHVWSAKQHIQHSWDPQLIILDRGTHTIEIASPSPRATMRSSTGQVYLADGQRRLVENFEVNCGG